MERDEARKSIESLSARLEIPEPTWNGRNVTLPIELIPMKERTRVIEKDPSLKKHDLIVITGAGGFIAGNLAFYLRKGLHQYPCSGQEAAL